MVNETPEFDPFEEIGEEELLENTIFNDNFHMRYNSRDKCQWGDTKGTI